VRGAFCLGELVIDPAAGRVLRPDGVHRLTARAGAAVLALAEHAGEPLARVSLMARVWPDGSGSDEALVRCIGDLRRALGDSGREHAFIETVPGQGYRLIVKPAAVTDADRQRLDTAANAADRDPPKLNILLRGTRQQRTLKIVSLYAAAIWPAMQVADLVFPRLRLPDIGVSYVIALGILGFPLVVAFAWFYKPPVQPVASSGVVQVRRFVIGLALLGTLGALAYFFARALEPPPRVISDRSIAVLPFVNMSGAPANDYLGDGLAEEITNLLTRLPDLEVASRTSAFGLRGSAEAVTDIARALGVRYILEGSIRRQGDELRITAQMIDASTGFHQWSRTYRRKADEVFDIEEDISKSVLAALKIVLSPDELQHLSRRATDSGDAYDAYLRGLSELRNATDAPALEEAVRQFEKSRAIDPTFAQAYAGLCQADVKRYQYLREPQSVVSAEESCARAVQLDSHLPDVHLGLGLLYSATGQLAAAETQYRDAIAQDSDLTEAYLGLATVLSQRDQLRAAEEIYQRAIDARPRYWASYDAYGSFLATQGRTADAIAQYRRATELVPENATVQSNLGAAYFLLGDFENAGASFRRSVEIAPAGEGYSNAATQYYYAGRYDDAAAMLEQAVAIAPQDHSLWGNLADAYRFSKTKAELAPATYAKATELASASLRVNPDNVLTRAQLAYFLARQQRTAEARVELAAAVREASAPVYVHYYAALAYLELGNSDSAIAELIRAVEAGYPPYLVRAAPEFDALKSDGRVIKLLKESVASESKGSAKQVGRS
jgi:TolB-like protein/DNA-binding winged helix-turn-helix (wHTH) protein/Tfp pilus assembly protein PilF